MLDGRPPTTPDPNADEHRDERPDRRGTDPSRRAFRRRPRIRAAVLAGVALATLAVAGAATLGLGGRGEGEPAPSRSGPAATTTVTRQTLVKEVALPGELGYGTPVPLTSAAAGTVTWLPEVGATVRRGRPLLRADEQPVVLLYGFLPMYRALTVDLTGSDVRQFERNLAALGYDGFTVDDDVLRAAPRLRSSGGRRISGSPRPARSTGSG